MLRLWGARQERHRCGPFRCQTRHLRCDTVFQCVCRLHCVGRCARDASIATLHQQGGCGVLAYSLTPFDRRNPFPAQKKINFVAFRERIASGTKLMTQSSMGATSASSMGAPPGGVPGGQAVQGGGRLFQGHPALSGHHVPQSTLPVTERTG